MKTVEVRYFAILREEAKLNKEFHETSAATARELYIELKEKHGFSLSEENIKLSLNQKYADLDSAIKEKDQLVFIPPVAGG